MAIYYVLEIQEALHEAVEARRRYKKALKCVRKTVGREIKGLGKFIGTLAPDRVNRDAVDSLLRRIE